MRVRSTSTVEVRQVIYSVPRTLIGRQVTVRLHHHRLVVYLGSDWVCQLHRTYGTGSHGPRAWCIDLDHLIDGLRAKPRALLHCRYQRHLSRMSTGGTSGSACWPAVTVTAQPG